MGSFSLTELGPGLPGGTTQEGGAQLLLPLLLFLAESQLPTQLGEAGQSRSGSGQLGAAAGGEGGNVRGGDRK